MQYFSTRGAGEELSFEEVVLAGLAPDGGLYIPAHIPRLPADWETAWASYSFVDLCVAVLSLYISPNEISCEELRALADKSYATFRHTETAPLVPLDLDQRAGGTWVLELFWGPTFAFKDVALQLLGNLFEFFLARRNQRRKEGEPRERLTVVGATSGDTGSAAIYGLRNKSDISIFILHPKGRVSPIQEAQMTTVTDPNVHNVAVVGTFDDCQDTVKALFADREFNAKHRLGAVNSINWARILAQTVYYFLAYFQLKKQLGGKHGKEEVQFVVPTGNFGDILAGWYARRMGLPMAKLVVATNANDILARFWKSGRYEKVELSAGTGAAAPAEGGASDGKQASAGAGGVRETLSPAMDIVVSSNFERLLWYLAHENVVADGAGSTGDTQKRKEACELLKGWMASVKSDGRVQVPVTALEAARTEFCAEKVGDDLTLETIQSYYERHPSYIADPHTAVGLAAAQIVRQNSAGHPQQRQIVLATAHPAKFSEAVQRALRSAPAFDFERDVLPPEFKGLLEAEKRVIDVERADVGLVKEVIEKFAVDETPTQVQGTTGV